MTRFDPNVDHPHHHLVCRNCGRMRDLVADFPDLQVPKGADLGFDVGSAEIVFRGLCPECQPAGASPEADAVDQRLIVHLPLSNPWCLPQHP